MTQSRTVAVPYSKVKFAVAQVLAQSGWIGGVTVHETTPKAMVLQLKYDEQGQAVIRSLRRISTPGRRVYVTRDRLPVVESNFGMAVISTSTGMMTNREARRRKLGGEVICEVS